MLGLNDFSIGELVFFGIFNKLFLSENFTFQSAFIASVVFAFAILCTVDEFLKYAGS